jgi:hypothetical protein
VRPRSKWSFTTSWQRKQSPLTDLLVHISARHWECRDFTRAELADAWTELATYVSPFIELMSVPAATIPKSASATPASFTPRPLRRATTARIFPFELFDFLEELLLLRRRGSFGG